MKRFIQGSLILVLFCCNNLYANTPTEALELTVNKLISIAKDTSLTDTNKKEQFTQIISSDMDFNAISKRVVSKSWRKTTDDQKQRFKGLFLNVMVNTYFSLFKEYTDEEVLYVKEQIKKEKYAIIDTHIVAGSKKIPVRYRLLKSKESWKIYDFIPEGISIVSNYKKNYATILKKSGMDGLLEQMVVMEKQKAEKQKAATEG